MGQAQGARARARVCSPGTNLEQGARHASVEAVRPQDIAGARPAADIAGAGPAADISAAVAAVVEAGHALAAENLVHGTSGNLSVRVGEIVAVTATGASLGELTPDQVTIVDMAGQVLDGRLAPTSELALHLEIYARYRPGAVVHAHPLTATALACVLDELPCLHPDMLELGGSIRVAAYHPFGSREFARATADALADRSAALMANHGTIVLGDDPGQATARTRLLEWAAEVYWRAARIGEPRGLTAAQQEALRARIARTGYGQTRPLDR